MTVDLTGDNVPVPLNDLQLRALGMTGTARALPAAGNTGAPLAVEGDLARALGNASMTVAHTAVIAPTSTPSEDSELTVRPADGTRAVLLVQDEAGATSWHFPHDPARSTNAPTSDATVLFRVPPHRLAAAPAPLEDAATKVLSVLEFPVGAALGRGVARFYEDWERRARPPVVTWFPPRPPLTRGVALSDATWRTLSQGPTLLFLHGIFSSCADGFAGLLDHRQPDVAPLWSALSKEYGDRIIGFDHPTASVAPEANAESFLAMIPDGVHLELDIVCHSRGGLVARILDGQLPRSSGSWSDVLLDPLRRLLGRRTDPKDKITVRKIVFIGTPNGGTAIVAREHWNALVDRFTTLLRLAPPGPWSVTTTTFEGVLELVKILAEGGEAALPGLRAMEPGSNLYARLDHATGSAATYYAIDTNYEPHTSLAGLFHLGPSAAALGNPAIDQVFDTEPNDIAVPTAGVGDPATVEPGGPGPHPPIVGFPVREDRRHAFGTGGVWHLTYFHQEETRQRLIDWLTKPTGTDD